MSKLKHTLRDTDITTEISSRRKFLRSMALASAGVGLATLGVVAATAADGSDEAHDANDTNDTGVNDSHFDQTQ